MKKHVFVSLLTAVALPLSMCSCTLRKHDSFTLFPKEESEPVQSVTEVTSETHATSSSGLEDVEQHAQQLIDHLSSDGAELLLKEDIELLLNDLDVCYEESTLKMIPYYLDIDNDELQAENDDMTEIFYEAYAILAYAFAQGAVSEAYGQLFEGFLSDEDVEYCTQPFMSMKRAARYAATDFELLNEQVQDYFDIAYDDELSDDEKDLKCAEIYLDLLDSYDTDTFYEQYYRDYTPGQIMELCETVKDELIPVSDEIVDVFFDDRYADAILDRQLIRDDPFSVILEYSPKLSADIAASAQKLVSEELYTIAEGDDCYDGSFTDELPIENSALIYVYDSKDYSRLGTAVHEFGHFHAALKDEVPQFFAVNNMDIAEIQSQGMELLFMQFYDDIYGKYADGMRLLHTWDILYSVITGFLVGEFEYTVLENRDTLTPQEVVECFDEIMGEFSDDYHFYYISHLFESPGYYISYGVSALAAFDIFDDVMNDPVKALERYEKIAAVSYNSEDNRFRTVLEECGYSDVLTDKYIIELADKLRSFIYS